MPPLQGHAFIGRHDALDALDRWAGEAAGGEPRLVAITGAAGVGKSRLLGRLIERQRTRAATVLLGTCHQGATIPYLPMVSALRPLFDRPVAPGAAPLRDALVAGPGRAGDASDVAGESRRLELFLSTAGAVIDAARQGPVVLAVEDLQWADQPSLELLGHVVSTVAQEASLGPLPVLLVLTRRDSAMPPPGEQLMARIRREPMQRELPLDGLTELETNLLLTDRLGGRPAGQLLLAVQEATSGNPLFVESLCRRLVEDGHLRRTSGVVAAPTDDLLGLPADLDRALQDSIDALSSTGRDLARRAAYLGDEGTLADLAAVSELDPAELETACGELEVAGLIVSGGPGFRFSHPQIRQLLYHDRIAGRAQLHLLIADRLEASGAEPGQVAMGIAYHLRRAGPGVDRHRLLRAATMAGDTAFALGAWAKAARELRSALDADAEGGLLSDGERAALEERAGTASFRDHDLVEAQIHAERAVDLARRSGDLEQWGSAVSLSMRIRFAHGASTVGHPVDAAPIKEYLQAAGHDQPRLRARLLGELAEMSFAAFEVRAGQDLAIQALDLAETTGDQKLIGDIRFALGLAHLGSLELDLARECFEASAEAAAALDDPWQQSWGLGRLPLVSLAFGELARAEMEVAAQVALATRTRDWAELSLATAIRSALASAQGASNLVESTAVETEQLYARSAFAFTPAVVYPALALMRARQGDTRGAAEALERWRAESGASIWRYELAVLLTSGQLDQARRRLEDRPYSSSQRPLSFFNADSVSVDVEVATLCADPTLAASALTRLAELASHGVVVMPGSGADVARLTGQALHVLGRDEEAITVLDHARHDAGRLGLAPEEARATYELARVLADQEPLDLPRLVDTLRAASAQADRLGLLPLLRAGHALFTTVVGAGPDREPPSTPPRTRVILISDLVGSTELNLRAGDAAWVDRLGRHDLLVRTCLRRHGGVEFKHTGDGVCAWFDSAPGAVECADDIRRQLAAATAEAPDLALVPRFGLSCGQPIGVGDDLFGIAVALAARLCAAAPPGAILASAEVAELGRGSGVALLAAGERTLKGFPDPVAVYVSVPPRNASSPAGDETRTPG